MARPSLEKSLRSPPFRVLASLFLALASTAPSLAAPALVDGFETDPQWTRAGGKPPFEVANLAISGRAAHRGTGGVDVRARTAHGAHFDLAYDVGRAPVIRELAAHLWVRADRPGAQILARIVLPRTTDPDSQKPISLYAYGDVYTTIGRWQRLSIDDLDTKTLRRARKLRTSRQSPIDERGAYVDRLVLRVRPGQGSVQLFIDDLSIDGIIADPPEQQMTGHPRPGRSDHPRPGRSERPRPGRSERPGRLPHQDAQRPGRSAVPDAEVVPAQFATPSGRRPEPSGTARVSLQGGVLLVDGRPFFPRAIEHSGETFSALRKIGFNVVSLPQVATREQLAAARKAGLWIVCPPPTVEGLSGVALARDFDVVLAWQMGWRLTPRELPWVRQWADAVKRNDPWTSRPLVGHVEVGLREASRFLDVLILDGTERPDVPPSFALRTLAQRQREARPGTPHWITVPTQLAATVREQARLIAELTGRPLAPGGLRIGQLERTALVGLAAGGKGLFFRSSDALPAKTPPTDLRATELELLSATLEPLDPLWATAEHSDGSPPSESGGASKLLRTEYGSVLVRVLDEVPHNRSAPSFPGHGMGPQSILVPAVPEATNVFRWSPIGLSQLVHRRAAGGLRVASGPPRSADILLFVQDGKLTVALARRAAASAKRARQLSDEVATANGVDASEKGSPRVSPAGVRGGRAVASGDPTRPMQDALHNLAQSATAREALVGGGGFESLRSTHAAGWRHTRFPISGVTTRVEIAPLFPHRGRGCLRLSATSANGQRTAPSSSASLWITSPAAPVALGELIRISGWARVQPAAEEGAVQVYDSIGGPPMAVRLDPTDAWRPFAIYRVAPRTEMIQVTITVAGLGKVWLDDVLIERLALPPRSDRAATLFDPPGASR